MNVLREILRRKARSVLTISGVGIGVFALVVMGASVENSNVYVDRLGGWFEETIWVVEKEGANYLHLSNGDRPLSMDVVEALRQYPGVQSADPGFMLLFDDEYFSLIPPTIIGVVGSTYPGAPEDLTLSSGRDLQPGDRRVAVLGSDLAKQLDAEVDDIIDVRGEDFLVVGLLDRTYINYSDSAAYVPIADAQQLYEASLPELFKGTAAPETLVTDIAVRVEPGQDPDALAEALARDIEGILATGPTKMMGTISGLVGLLAAIAGSVAAVALLVSGLSIINTMTMAVLERTREIGVKRALGASRWRIARDVLSESAVMGGLGGIGGVISGAAVALSLNSAMIAATGTTALVVTPRLVAGAFAFAVVLGALGGLLPARYASRLDPATALTYE